MGFPPVRPPSSDVSKAEALQNLWTDAGLDRVETRKIEVQRTFTDFDDFWTTAMLGSTIGPTVASMPPDDAELLKRRMCARRIASRSLSSAHSRDPLAPTRWLASNDDQIPATDDHISDSLRLSDTAPLPERRSKNLRRQTRDLKEVVAEQALEPSSPIASATDAAKHSASSRLGLPDSKGSF